MAEEEPILEPTDEELAEVPHGMTPEEEEDYLQAMMGSLPGKEDRLNTHAFLTAVVKSKDTTRIGNLKEEEVGLPKLPLRTYKELSLFCKDVANMDYFSDYFDKKGQILTATSLSKDAKLIDLSVLQRREIKQGVRTASAGATNKGWFKKKEGTAEL